MGRNETLRAVWAGLLVAVGALAHGEAIVERVDAHRDDAVALAQDLFDYAELGYLETRSVDRLTTLLESNGFEIEREIAGIPTAFLAEAGSGKPIIGILAEYDALPGLSQSPVPNRSPVVADAAGHACGHHLFGSASTTAAIAVAEWLEANGREGTVRVYGTPAEEGGSGKVYLTREGYFDDVDIVLHWHPSSSNRAAPESSTSNKSGRFRFHGIAAHAAAAPHRGRSALDGVESMNYMVNLMREHVPSDSRIHYVITDGGRAPNIVPEFAEVYYYVRNPKADIVASLFERVVAAARGAELGTETRMTYEVMHGNFPLLRNDTLAGVLHEEMTRVGGYTMDAEQIEFATTIRETLFGALPPLSDTEVIHPSVFTQKMGSTDVGDVSWNVPTAGFGTATWVPGTPAHSWQAVAAGGMSIGHEGMMMAARILAASAVRLFEDDELLRRAWAEFEERRGANFEYVPLLGDRNPPLDYRL